MKFSYFTAIALPLLQMVNGQQGACERIRIRKEIRDLNDQERRAWMNAIRTLYLSKLSDGYNSYIDWFAYVHIQEYDKVHSDPKFLPWHRYFLYILQSLVNRVDDSVTIPYWDWARDSQAVHNSPVLTNSYIGGNGNGNRGWDLTSGPFGNMPVNYPEPHTLKRCYHRTDGGRRFPSPTIDPFPDTVRMNAIVNQYESFSEFAWNLELHHGYLHVLLGDFEGDLGPPQSPNDPAFFLHHANIDRYWWQWQRRHSDRARDYEGRNYDPPKSGNSNDNMSFAGTLDEVPVYDTFDTTAYPFCYTYAENNRQMLDADGQPKPLVNGTKLLEKTVTFDKIKDLSNKANDNTVNSSNTKNETPKIKEINPLVLLGMAQNMNMKMNLQKGIDTITKQNKQLKALSSLDGFNDPNKN